MTHYPKNVYYVVIIIFTVFMMVFFSIATLTVHTRSEEALQKECAVELQRKEALIETVTEELQMLEADETPVLKYVTCQKVEHYDIKEEASDDTEPIADIDEHDIELLACVIYQEAGSDSVCDLCRRRVADVVLNRVSDSRYAGTSIEEILMDANPSPQWGLYSVTGVIWPEKAYVPSEAAAVERAYRIAREVLEGQHSDLTMDYIWLAEFPQGKDVVQCDGIYFGK